MSDGFLGRWSRRKLDAKQDRAAEPDAAAAPSPPPAPQEASFLGTPLPSPASGRGSSVKAESSVTPSPPRGEGGGEGPHAELPPPPTLEDVKSLTPESDFRRFAAADVAPEVKNAALKKLFADPRFNLMDGMDVYIDDYSKPDPMPASMLRQLATSQFLGLFKEEDRQETPPAGQARDDADNPMPQKVAQSGSVPRADSAPPTDADPDLQLQQNHAAPGEDPGRGTG